MSSIIFSLPEFYNSYKRWVALNPLKATDYELTTKWISYFIAGRINSSHIVSELVYCVSNLLVLFNDRLIAEFHRNEAVVGFGETLKLWLTVLEYCEVFLELSASKLWGYTGKWIVVVSIQVFKCLSRLLLVFHHKESIIQQPPIPQLERKDLHKPLQENGMAEMARAQLDSISFNLKRSGRVVRKIDASPPVRGRSWKPIHRADFDNEQTIEQALAGQQLIAETVYILKPIIHLGSMACFGGKSWKQWIVSLVLDLGSLRLYDKTRHSLTTKQKLEVSRRTVGLVLYLLRSPFYDRHSKKRISSFLTAMSNNVPLAAMLCKPLDAYVPFWQNIYFYMWST